MARLSATPEEHTSQGEPPKSQKGAPLWGGIYLCTQGWDAAGRNLRSSALICGLIGLGCNGQGVGEALFKKGKQDPGERHNLTDPEDEHPLDEIRAGRFDAVNQSGVGSFNAVNEVSAGLLDFDA